jgi:hypothetical protein
MPEIPAHTFHTLIITPEYMNEQTTQRVFNTACSPCIIVDNLVIFAGLTIVAILIAVKAKTKKRFVVGVQLLLIGCIILSYATGMSYLSLIVAPFVALVLRWTLQEKKERQIII